MASLPDRITLHLSIDTADLRAQLATLDRPYRDALDLLTEAEAECDRLRAQLAGLDRPATPDPRDVALDQIAAAVNSPGLTYHEGQQAIARILEGMNR